MFDERKFDKILNTTDKLLTKYKADKDAQKVIHDNLIILVDMIFNELSKGIYKENYRGYLKIADELYKSVVRRWIGYTQITSAAAFTAYIKTYKRK